MPSPSVKVFPKSKSFTEEFLFQLQPTSICIPNCTKKLAEHRCHLDNLNFPPEKVNYLKKPRHRIKTDSNSIKNA